MENHESLTAWIALTRRLCLALFGLLLVHSIAFAQISIPPGGLTNIPPGGTLSLPCTSLTVQGQLNVNSGQVSNAGGVNISAGGTVNGGSGTINNGGSWNNSGTFNAGSGTVVFSGSCTAGQIVISGNTVFNNLTITGASGATFVIPSGVNITVNGVLTIQGTGAQPINLISSSGQPAIFFLGPQASVVTNNVSLNNVQIGATPTSIPALGDSSLLLLSLLLLASALGIRRKGLLQ